jgi:multimeric flavodoxin WrbA
MNALGISGSPRENGNTSFSVQYALNQLKEKNINTQYISLSDMNILNCKGCWECSKNKKCFQKDDMDFIYEAFRKADVIILGSPVYFGMVSGLMKNMMDRCVVFRPSYDMGLELEGKIGCGISCGGFRNGGQETTLQNIHTFLLQQNIKVINDGFPYSHAGATIVGEANNDIIGLKTIDNLVNNIIKMTL